MAMAAMVASAPSEWSDRPTGTPKAAARVVMARRFISSAGAGYSEVQCRTTIGRSSPPPLRTAASPASTSARLPRPVDRITGRPLAPTAVRNWGWVSSVEPTLTKGTSSSSTRKSRLSNPSGVDRNWMPTFSQWAFSSTNCG